MKEGIRPGSNHNEKPENDAETIGARVELADKEVLAQKEDPDSIDDRIESKIAEVLGVMREVESSVLNVDESMLDKEAQGLFARIKDAVRRLGDGLSSIIEAHPKIAGAAGLAISAGVAMLCWKVIVDAGAFVDMPGAIHATFVPNPDSVYSTGEHVAAIAGSTGALIGAAWSVITMLGVKAD